MTDEELHNLVRQRLHGVMTNNRARQRIVRLNELEELIQEGWENIASCQTTGSS